MKFALYTSEQWSISHVRSFGSYGRVWIVTTYVYQVTIEIDDMSYIENCRDEDLPEKIGGCLKILALKEMGDKIFKEKKFRYKSTVCCYA